MTPGSRRSDPPVVLRRWIPGTDPLAPAPYTASQRADLVARTRAAMEDSAARSRAGAVLGGAISRHRTPVRRGPPLTSRGRCAARYARMFRCSLLEAGLAFGISEIAIPSLTSLCRVGARLVELTGCSYAAAAETLLQISNGSATMGGIRTAWRRIYGSVERGRWGAGDAGDSAAPATT